MSNSAPNGSQFNNLVNSFTSSFNQTKGNSFPNMGNMGMPSFPSSNLNTNNQNSPSNSFNFKQIPDSNISKPSNTDDKAKSVSNPNANEEITRLKNQVASLTKQLEEKQKQIDELTKNQSNHTASSSPVPPQPSPIMTNPFNNSFNSTIQNPAQNGFNQFNQQQGGFNGFGNNFASGFFGQQPQFMQQGNTAFFSKPPTF